MFSSRFKCHRLYSAQGEESEQEGRDKIIISLLHTFVLTIQISVPNLLFAVEVVAQNDISKGGKNICHQDHAREESYSDK